MKSIYDNKILVVNDSSSMVELIKRLMNKAGFHHIDTDDGESAKKMLEMNAYDLLIQDLQRPEPPSGRELYRWMKADERIANVPIILFTAGIASFLSDVRFTVIGKKKFEITHEVFFDKFGQYFIEGCVCGTSNYREDMMMESVEDQAARIFRFWMNCRDPEKERERRNRYLWPDIRQDWQ
jgi:hypothetical protein